MSPQAHTIFCNSYMVVSFLLVLPFFCASTSDFRVVIGLMRALAALGYIGGQAPDSGKSFRDLPDPKGHACVRWRRGRRLRRGPAPWHGVSGPAVRANCRTSTSYDSGCRST